MDGAVPSLSIACMALALLAGAAIPAALFAYFRKRMGCDTVPFFVGCAVMLLFALVLESAVHRAVLGSALGGKIQASAALYALYGGLAAGLFEETGRLLAFLTVLKKYRGNDDNALMYGAGHGGFEALAVLSLTMLNNIVIALMVNTGRAETLTAGLSGGALVQAEAAVSALIATPWRTYLAGIAERVIAVALQLSFSVLVWFAVKARKRYLYPAAIVLHCAADALAVVLSRSGASVWLAEAALAVLAALYAVIAARVRRSSAQISESEV